MSYALQFATIGPVNFGLLMILLIVSRLKHYFYTSSEIIDVPKNPFVLVYYNHYACHQWSQATNHAWLSLVRLSYSLFLEGA